VCPVLVALRVRRYPRIGARLRVASLVAVAVGTGTSPGVILIPRQGALAPSEALRLLKSTFKLQCEPSKLSDNHAHRVRCWWCGKVPQILRVVGDPVADLNYSVVSFAVELCHPATAWLLLLCCQFHVLQLPDGMQVASVNSELAKFA